MYDIIIVGMGISGITAAIFAKRRNMKVLLLDKKYPGGLLNNIDTISNYPGLIAISGPDFAQILLKQIQALDIEYKLEEVISLDLKKEIKIVKTKSKEYQAKKVILALGRKPKYLGLDNELDYLGRGVATSALKEAKSYQDKVIAVVGTGNSALQETLYLTKYAKKIYLLNRRDAFRGEEKLVDEVKKNEKIEIIYNVTLKKINEENKKINSIKLSNEQNIKVEGIFVYIGYRPDTNLVKEYKILDSNNYIKVDYNYETSIKDVYAIGDCIPKDVFLLITAASDGAKVIYRMK